MTHYLTIGRRRIIATRTKSSSSRDVLHIDVASGTPRVIFGSRGGGDGEKGDRDERRARGW